MKRRSSRYRYAPYQPRRRRPRLKPAPVLFCLLVLVLAIWGCGSLLSGGEAEPDSASSAVSSEPEASSQSQKEPEPEVDKSAWYLVLANQTHPLDKDFAPETKELPNGLEVDARIYDSLMQMVEDAESQGLDLVVCSAYRPYELQVRLFEEQIQMEMDNGHSQQEAEELAATTVAIPGTSEHQTGLAVDIVAMDYQNLDEGVMETPEVKWLYAHCHEYGFIVRYPDGKSDITKIIYEPWHYRYVGKEAATQIMEQGITLEEYLDEVD